LSHSPLEGRAFETFKVMKEVINDLKGLTPYIENTQHRVRLEAILWKLEYQHTYKVGDKTNEK